MNGYCEICGYEWPPEARPRYCPRCDFAISNNEPDKANMNNDTNTRTEEEWSATTRYADEHAGEFTEGAR